MLSSWKYSAQQEEIQTYLFSEEFTPNGFNKRVSRLNSQKIETKLFKAYYLKLRGNHTGFTNLMAELVPRYANFNKNPFLHFLYNLQLSYYYAEQGSMAKAKSAVMMGNLVATSARQKDWQAYLYAQLGQIYSDEGLKDSSFSSHKKSIEFAKRSEGLITLSRCLHDFACSNAIFSQVERSVEQELHALLLVQKIKNDYYTSLFCQFIAKLSLEAGVS